MANEFLFFPYTVHKTHHLKTVNLLDTFLLDIFQFCTCYEVLAFYKAAFVVVLKTVFLFNK